MTSTERRKPRKLPKGEKLPRGESRARPWVPGQACWEWEPWARFLGARAQLIHQATAEGKSPAHIRAWLSMDEEQVRLIAGTSLDLMPGIPGKIWPPSYRSPSDP